MKNHPKRLTIISFIVFFAMIALTVYFFKTTPLLKQEAAAKQQDRDRINQFIETADPETVVNTTATAMLEHANDQDEDVKYTYRTSEGIDMISYSDAWDVDKLKALYEELKLNKHGEEFNALDRVTVYAESDEYAAGDNTSQMDTVDLTINLPCVAYDSAIEFTTYVGIINLYNGDEYTTVAEMAHVLSHEYGHHFTFYYFFPNGKVTDSEYEEIRGVSGHEIYYDWTSNRDFYQNNHQWFLIEMAAEDYVQLMGSPLTRNVTKYIDVNQALYGAAQPKIWRSYNGFAQENPLIPFADEVDGLAAYYYSFLPEETYVEPSTSKKTLNLTIAKGYSYHNSVSGPLNFTHYTLAWDNVYPGAIYTVMYTDKEASAVYPIKTVYPGQSNVAYIGTVSYETDNMIYWEYDNTDTGTKLFYVNALLPDGTLYRSNILKYKFN